MTSSALILEIGDMEAQGQARIAGLLARQPAWAKGAISAHDARFLAGLLLHLQPACAVEIGVASGWSGAVMLQALHGPGAAGGADATGGPGATGATGGAGGVPRIHGIDTSPTFYLDAARPTGSAIREVLPAAASAYRLHAGRGAFEAMEDVAADTGGPVGFGFIDAHHMHPWTTLDMIALLPFLPRGGWVAMHDLNLCRFPRHKHAYRGPFYLWNFWPDTKLHSTQVPPMIGAVRLVDDPARYLDLLVEILNTPWEIGIDAATRDICAAFCQRHFGADARALVMETFDRKNPARLA